LAFWPFQFFTKYKEEKLPLACSTMMQAGVDKATEGHPNVSTWYKHSDLVCVIRSIIYKLKADHLIKVTFFHVAGHQDCMVPYEQLTQPEQLNYEMDIHAKARVHI
jgi:hypothetical protein